MKTPEQVKRELEEAGITQSDWARRHGYRPNQVSRVLNGHDDCKRGQAREIAKALGLPTPLKRTPQLAA
jgi:gp16 family phage-associated protein